MRAIDPAVIEKELQEKLDKIQNEFDIVGEIRPVPSPNTATQLFLITCTEKACVEKYAIQKPEKKVVEEKKKPVEDKKETKMEFSSGKPETKV